MTDGDVGRLPEVYTRLDRIVVSAVITRGPTRLFQLNGCGRVAVSGRLGRSSRRSGRTGQGAWCDSRRLLAVVVGLVLMGGLTGWGVPRPGSSIHLENLEEKKLVDHI